MRVLIVAAPLTGHLLPLVPLAVALRDQGHEVVIASGTQPATVAGFAVHDVSSRVRMGPILARLAVTRPGLALRELRGTAGTDMVGRLFGMINAAMVDDVVAYAEAVRPDLVVHEPLAVSGAVAAARCGVPAVLLAGMLWDGTELVRSTAARPALVAAAARHQVRRLPAASVITTAPASVVGPRLGRPMRPGGLPAETSEPAWLYTPPSRPRLLVSHSTVVGPGSDTAHVERIVRVAGQLDADVVLVRAPKKVTGRSLPANVTAVGWVSLDAALGFATAIVHHGGAGTTLGALAAGVPQLVVPGAGDRRYNAGLVAARGAGLAVATGDITAEVLTTLLTAPPLRAAAGEVAAETAAMPTPDDVAAQLARSE